MANLLLLNFGTFIETNRFKALAAQGGFAEHDVLDTSPDGLIKKDGVRKVTVAGATVHSFYELSSAVWKSNIDATKAFKTEFKSWLERGLEDPVQCIYMTGHHWSHDDEVAILSWEEEQKFFHARFGIATQTLEFGVTGDRVDVDTANLRADCRLVFGFGCNVCGGANSTKYQRFFAPSVPLICGWTESITLAKGKAPSVNKRFFEYLDLYAKEPSRNVPAADRVTWFYDNDSMQLVKAWGWATKVLGQRKARARDKDGTFYKFQVNKKGWPEPVKV